MEAKHVNEAAQQVFKWSLIGGGLAVAWSFLKGVAFGLVNLAYPGLVYGAIAGGVIGLLNLAKTA